MEFGIGYLPKYPWLPLESTSPIFGIPRSDTDEDLKTQPVLVKKSTPRKLFGSSLDRSKNPVEIPTTAHDGKLRYDPVTAIKL